MRSREGILMIIKDEDEGDGSHSYCKALGGSYYYHPACFTDAETRPREVKEPDSNPGSLDPQNLCSAAS